MKPTAWRGFFPLPAVVGKARPPSGSSRVRQRFTMARNVTNVTNGAISSLNSLFSPKLHTPPTYHDSTNSTTPIFRAHTHLSECAARYIRRGGLRPISGDSISSPAMAATAFPSSYHCQSPSIPLCSDKVFLPTTLKFTNLLDILPHDIAHTYSAPDPDIMNPDGAAASAKAPAAFLVSSQSDYCDLTKLSTTLAWWSSP